MEFKRILLIEDDEENQTLLKEILGDKFKVETARDGEEGFRIARAETPDLILLDLMMPKLDGIETCGLLRSHEATRHIPVIVITGSNDFELQLKALDIGADDLLQKPFRPRELLARISSKIRRIEETQKQPVYLKRGNLELDLERFEARVESNLIVLSVLEFNLLRYFVENFNRVLTREKILQAVWREAIVTDRTVDTHMTSLRKKLQGSTVAFSTLYGAGYILKERELSSSGESRGGAPSNAPSGSDTGSSDPSERNTAAAG